MTTFQRYTSEDLDSLPNVKGIRYEIIDGDLYVSKQPHWHHQYVCSAITAPLHDWSVRTDTGVVLGAPGLIFSPDNDVVPDLIWISHARLAQFADSAGHMRGAPELAIEVLSFGSDNERRDRLHKLRLYSRQGVQEYWIANWRARTLDVYLRNGAELTLQATLGGDDVLTTSLLPGFSLPLPTLWPPTFRTPGLVEESDVS